MTDFMHDFQYQRKDYNDLAVEELKNKLILGKQNNEIIKLSEMEMKLILDYITQTTYVKLIEEANLEESLTDNCDITQAICGKMLEELGITVYLGESHQAIRRKVKPLDIIVHYFIVVEMLDINSKKHYFLLDLAYRQFLIKEKCENQADIYNNYQRVGNAPGYFLSKSDAGIFFAKQMIETGYCELNAEIAKLYGDSFYLGRIGDIKDDLVISGDEYMAYFLSESGYSNKYNFVTGKLRKERY